MRALAPPYVSFCLLCNGCVVMVPLPFPLFIGAQIYRGSSYGALHPLAIPRVPTVIDLCQALDWLPRAQYRTSPCAKPAMLETFHTPQYIAALQAAESAGRVSDLVRDRHQIGTASNPVFAEMFRRPTTAAGGSLLAVELLRNGGIVYNPGGGTHHGMPDRANGFCYLNDPFWRSKRCVVKALSGSHMSISMPIIAMGSRRLWRGWTVYCWSQPMKSGAGPLRVVCTIAPAGWH